MADPFLSMRLTISTFNIYERPFRGSVSCPRTLRHADGEDWGLNCRPSEWRTTTLPHSHTLSIRGIGGHSCQSCAPLCSLSETQEEELQLLVARDRSFSLSYVLCFTETWLCGSTLVLCCSWKASSCSERTGTQISPAKRKVGICFYTNSSWCNNVTVIQQHCTPVLETFYYPREFASFIQVCVNIPTQANEQDTQCTLNNQILCVERTDPDSLVTVLLILTMISQPQTPQTQFVKWPTREENTLDHCYTTVSEAHHVTPPLCTGTLWPRHGPPDSSIQAEIKALKTYCEGWAQVQKSEWIPRGCQFIHQLLWRLLYSINYQGELKTRDKPWFKAKLRWLRLQKEKAFRCVTMEHSRENSNTNSLLKRSGL